MTKQYRLRKPKKTSKLTKDQEQILIWLTSSKHMLTVRQIAREKGLLDSKGNPKTKSIYNTISKLKKKGYLTITNQVNDNLYKQIPKDKFLRLHAECFSIKILAKSHQYMNILKSKTQDIVSDNTIELKNNYLEIYSNKDFWGESVEECFKESTIYWNNFLKKLENLYNIILIKPNGTKIYKFRQHIADIRDPLSKKVIDEGKDFKVYDKKGVLRLIIDNSILPEKETVSNKYCKQDMERLVGFNQDLVENPQSFNLSELTTLSSQNTINVNKLTEEVIKMNQTLKITVQTMQTTIQMQQNIINMIIPKQKEVKEDCHIYGSYFM